MRGWPSHLSGRSKATLYSCEDVWLLRLGFTRRMYQSTRPTENYHSIDW